MRAQDVSPPRPMASFAAYRLSQSAGQDDALILTKTNARSRCIGPDIWITSVYWSLMLKDA